VIAPQYSTNNLAQTEHTEYSNSKQHLLEGHSLPMAGSSVNNISGTCK